MFQLTKEQKLENIRELLVQKKQKIKNLQIEVQNLQRKLENFEIDKNKNSNQETKSSNEIRGFDFLYKENKDSVEMNDGFVDIH